MNRDAGGSTRCTAERVRPSKKAISSFLINKACKTEFMSQLLLEATQYARLKPAKVERRVEVLLLSSQETAPAANVMREQ